MKLLVRRRTMRVLLSQGRGSLVVSHRIWKRREQLHHPASLAIYQSTLTQRRLKFISSRKKYICVQSLEFEKWCQVWISFEMPLNEHTTLETHILKVSKAIIIKKHQSQVPIIFMLHGDKIESLLLYYTYTKQELIFFSHWIRYDNVT